jgi:5-hydroxyisourate hydrolase
MTRISTHVLDSGSGEPVHGMEITLSRMVEGQRIELARGRTGSHGRIESLWVADEVLKQGAYCLHFATGEYFIKDSAFVCYPYIEVVFNLDGKQPNYHIPLVFSPYGYSTYMGS